METVWGSPEAHDRLSLSELWQSLYLHFREFLSPPLNGAVLDIECGTGRLSLMFGSSASSVVGVDTSLEFLARAERNRQEAGCAHVSFHAASVESLPFPDATFDVVTSFSLLCLMPEPARALAEIVRVLRKGGVFGGVLISQRMTSDRIAEFVALHRLPNEVGEALLLFQRQCAGGYSERALERLLLNAGLRTMRTIEQADGLMLLVKAWR